MRCLGVRCRLCGLRTTAAVRTRHALHTSLSALVLLWASSGGVGGRVGLRLLPVGGLQCCTRLGRVLLRRWLLWWRGLCAAVLVHALPAPLRLPRP